jgi:hypothetical protein
VRKLYMTLTGNIEGRERYFGRGHGRIEGKIILK